MLVNYIKVALRSIWRFRQHYLLNALGLFMGTTVFLLLLQYTQPFLSFDGFHDKSDRIVRLNSIINLPEQTNKYAATSFRIGPEIAANYPEIESMVRLRNLPVVVEHEEIRFDASTALFADSTFLHVFSFKLEQGDDRNFLSDPSNIAISEELAVEYFNGENAIGQVLQVIIQNEVRNLTVRAVLANPPANSSIQFSILASMQVIENSFGPGYGSLMPGHFTFFSLHNNRQVGGLQAKLPSFVTNHLPEGLNQVMELELQPLAALHFSRDYQFDLGRKSRKSTLLALLGLGLMTLMIAIVNFINMGTALTIKRNKEMAVRKILGSSRMGVLKQLVIEKALVIFVVAFLSGLTILRTLPWLSREVEFDFELLSFAGISFWIWLLLFTCLVVGTVSFYPAWSSARISLATGIERVQTFVSPQFSFRHLVLVFQIAAAIFFLVAAWVMVDQLLFLKNKELGFDQDHVVQVSIANPTLRDKILEVKQQMLGLSSIASVSSSTSGINGDHVQATFHLEEGESTLQFLMDLNYVDPNFMETYGTQLLAGRDFSDLIPSDVRGALIINESAASEFNLEPKDILGKTLTKVTRDTTKSIVIGVVADYHSRSLHQEVAPLIWQIDPSAFQNVLGVKLRGDLDRSIDQLQEGWDAMQLGVPLNYEFLDESIAIAYRTERQVSKFIKAVTAILIFITCSGLYSMMLFVTEQKRSEIGIRKVLGASVQNLILHLNRQNILVIILGFVLGAPLALLALNRWLLQFAYRIEPQWYHLVGSGGFCAILALASVTTITYRATLLDPIEVIRDG